MAKTTIHRSDEMETLMNRVQQLIEANVLAMVVRRADGRIALSCPPAAKAEVLELLRTYDWNSLA